MKPGMLLCLLLLSGCSLDPGPPKVFEYALTWTCLSADEGCEGAEDLMRIDRMDLQEHICQFTSTQDESYGETAQQVFSDELPRRCSWMYSLSLLGHELERQVICFVPGGFEMEISLPNEDQATFSQWLLEGRKLHLL